jgi:hypothetical protein
MEQAKKEFNLRVTEDGMAVLLDGDIITDELDPLVVALGNELKTLGIKDPPGQKQLKEQLHRAAKENPHLVDFVLIKGKPSVPPQHGRVDWADDFFSTGFVVDKKTGRADYRQKAAHESVTKGTLLARQIPVKEGKDGQNVYGKPIPAEKPMENFPEVGENVRFSTQENAYYANTDGRVRLANNVLSVDEVYVIQGNVDLTTGNISHTGAVVVNKDVLNGAKIEAVGNIEVHGIIENAEIRTGGDLTVHGGIRQSEDHMIVVEGGIHAKFIDGGYIQANADIVVESEIVNSTVKTLGSVSIPGGHIVGGKTVALKGIYVGQAGSKAYTPTMLVAGDNFSIGNKLSLSKKKIKRIEEGLTKLKSFVAKLRAKPRSISAHGQEEYEKKQSRISEAEQELQSLIEEVEDIKAKALGSAKNLIVVEKKLYPKTTLCLGDNKLIVDEEYSGPIRAEIVKGEIKLN